MGFWFLQPPYWLFHNSIQARKSRVLIFKCDFKYRVSIHVPALSPCHQLRNKGFQLHTNVVHLLSKWITQKVWVQQTFYYKTDTQSLSWKCGIYNNRIISWSKTLLPLHWINLLNFNWHYNMIILVNRTLIIYVSAWWRICCQGLLCFSIISLSSFAFCSASSAFDPLIKTITIKNIQIKVHIYIYLDLPAARVDSRGLELTVKIFGEWIVFFILRIFLLWNFDLE